MTNDDLRLNPPDYMFNPLLEAIIFGIVVFLAVLHANYFLYEKARLAQMGEINDGLTMFSRVVASYVDAEKHQRLVSPEQQDSELYNDTMKPLSALIEANPDIVNVYTMVLIDGNIFFILDPTLAGDSDGDGQDDKAYLMEQYESPPADLVYAFAEKTGKVTESPYMDKWGNYFSSFSPLIDEHGEMYGMLGVDVSASGYFTRLKPIQRHYLRSSAASFFVAFVIGCSIWFLRRFSQVLHENRKRLANALNAETSVKKLKLRKQNDF